MLPAQIPAAAPEVNALGSALYDFIAAIKAGKSVVQAAEAAEGDLISAIGSISKIGTDITQAHNQAYMGWAVAQVWEPDTTA